MDKDSYRGWTITQGRWPEPAWSATSPNYDASYEGEEDGWVDNGEKADAKTRELLIAEIDAWFEEHEMQNATAWLIEMIHSDAPAPRYWNHSKFRDGWVWDASDAMRFCREQDARDFLDGLSMPLQGRPVEHKFLAQPNPPASIGRDE